MATEAVSPPATGMGDHPFAQASVAFAVDRSGSTHGRPLRAELSFIEKVATLLDADRRPFAQVIPWDHKVDRVVGLQGLSYITSRGGTEPSSILKNQLAGSAVAKSSLWFLMTDGMISDRDQERFAGLVPQAGIHGIACVPVIFGDMSMAVSSCNISVGVSLFSICPNSLFLFVDTASEEIVIMQTKGCFNTLLKGEENPTIDNSSTWASFPRLSLDALSDIIIPAPKKLASDQVALQGSLVVNFEDLWANKLSPTQVDQIFANEDSLNTITMAAGSRGAQTNAKFQTWVQAQGVQSVDPLQRPRHDIGGLTRLAFLDLMVLSKAGGPVDASRQEQLRLRKEQLRIRHITNMKEFLRSCAKQKQAVNVRQQHIRKHYQKSTGRYSSANALSSANKITVNHDLPPPDQSSGHPTFPQAVVDADASSIGSKRLKTNWIAAPLAAPPALPTPATNNPWLLSSRHQQQPVALDVANIPAAHALAPGPVTRPAMAPAAAVPTPAPIIPALEAIALRVPAAVPAAPTAAAGPAPPDSWASLKETCGDVNLQNLLCTPGFRSGANSFRGECAICGMTDATLAWLFASSPDASGPTKAGSLSTLICCDPCSTYCVATGQSLHNETILAALPMVEFASQNATACHQALLKALPNHSAFDVENTFRSVLAMKDMVLAGGAGKELFHKAAIWAWADMVPNRLEELVKMTTELGKLDSTVAQRPLPEFLLTLRSAAVLGRVPAETRRRAAYLRYLFFLTESAAEALPATAPPGDVRDVTEAINKILWQEAEDPDMVLITEGSDSGSPQTDEATRTRTLSLPMSALRGSPLLSEEKFQLLDGAEEFRTLGSETACPTAVFLHALMDVAEKHNYATAMELFNLVRTRKELAPVFATPEAVDVDGVASMLKSLRL